MNGTPDLSVVIAAKNSRTTVVACLRSVFSQIGPERAEVIVADGSSDGTADIVAEQFPDLSLLRGEADLLVPQLWLMGISAARGHLVAITIADCIPNPDWLVELTTLAREFPGYGGFGGPIDGPENGRGLDWAAYFSRYTAYLDPAELGPAAEIPGDNAAYPREMLSAWCFPSDGGFWEALVHARMRKAGIDLLFAPKMRVRLGTVSGAWQFAGTRFRHGRHYGSTRPAASAVIRSARCMAAPLLAPFLLLRIVRRVAARRPDLTPELLRSLPWLSLFLLAWSLGEAAGYLSPGQRAKW